ncbi:hypothetical protein GGR42_002966 [Saonia flava]|uniref:DUF1573 domain-containing protein n=1 Tax=Saonia flava TaxID=523696 RepID=A0A846R3C3_9FLAO|nr:DUF1573 domain-containing protein [Saonia flava]NJB72475.1 hypothetical protein [Saonia flava]
MKKTSIVLVISCLVVLFSCKEKASNKVNVTNVEAASQRDAAAKSLPIMTFDKSEHDFGTIDQGTPQEFAFTFTNTGNAPLIITDAKSTCGCTVPNPPKEPIAPGETGELMVKFNGSGQNQVTKSITVTANTEKGSEIIRIKAFVTPKAGVTPAAGPLKVSK